MDKNEGPKVPPQSKTEILTDSTKVNHSRIGRMTTIDQMSFLTHDIRNFPHRMEIFLFPYIRGEGGSHELIDYYEEIEPINTKVSNVVKQVVAVGDQIPIVNRDVRVDSVPIIEVYENGFNPLVDKVLLELSKRQAGTNSEKEALDLEIMRLNATKKFWRVAKACAEYVQEPSDEKLQALRDEKMTMKEIVAVSIGEEPAELVETLSQMDLKDDYVCDGAEVVIFNNLFVNAYRYGVDHKFTVERSENSFIVKNKSHNWPVDFDLGNIGISGGTGYGLYLAGLIGIATGKEITREKKPLDNGLFDVRHTIRPKK